MKISTVIFSPIALERAFIYYEETQFGLGKRFVSQLNSTLISIKRNPFFASVRYNDIRCVQIKKFPYLVHYHIDENNRAVTIVAVYSTYKKPLW